MTHSIYLFEHDAAFRQVLTFCLEQEGWQVTALEKGDTFFEHGADGPYLWILDADGEEGFNIMREVKARTASKAHIIMTSERERVIDRVLGLELGCDDFIVKPFSPRELILRTRRIFGREKSEYPVRKDELISLQSYSIDIQRRIIVNSEGETVRLTAKEFDLLLLFAQHRGLALSREQIIHFVWGENYFGSDRVVDDLIRRTRRKVKKLRIEALYGYGYRIS